MSNHRETIRFDIDVFNDTSGLKIAEAEESTRNAITIKKASDYSVSIDRFNVPITNIEVHKITDTTNYDISIESNIEYDGTNYNSVGASNLQLTSINRIRSPSDFVEYVNRALARAHDDLITTNFSSDVQTIGPTTLRFTDANDAGPPIGDPSKNIAITLTGTECYYVRLVLSGYAVNAGADTQIVNIDLANPSGTVCRVASGVILEASKTYTFESGGIKSQENMTTQLDSNYSMQPVDSFLKYANQGVNGNWVISITQAGESTALDIDVDVSLTISQPPLKAGRYNFPNIPPNISVDANGYIVWQFHERFLHHHFQVKLGRNLKQILSIAKSIDIADNYLSIPITLLSSGLSEVVNFTAEAKKLYQLNQLRKVLIVSNSLPVSKDVQLSNKPSFALTSFLLPSAEIENFTEISYSFTGGSLNPRYFTMNSDDALTNFNIGVQIQRVDGSVENLFLEPNESMNILLTFHKAYRI